MVYESTAKLKVAAPLQRPALKPPVEQDPEAEPLLLM